MKKILLFASLACISLFLTSCEVEDSADVNQDKIYTDYEVFYNANSDKTLVTAKFRFGGPTGTNLELISPAQVTFNGEVLAFNLVYQGHHKEFAGRVDGGTFEYTNTEDDVFTNTTPAYEAIAFPTGIDTVSKSSALSLAWDGTALAADQNVGLFIGTWTFGDDALFFTDADGATDLVLGTTALSNLAIGASTFFMDRATVKEVEEGTGEGGLVRGKYRAENKSVQIVE